MPDPSPDRPRVELLDAPALAPAAEIRIARDRLWVTVWLPGLRLSDARILISETTMEIIGSGLDLRFTLPARVAHGRFVARAHNGVLDIVIERARRA